MDFIINNNNIRMVDCPIFHREIDEGLCWEISNIGDDSLKLPPHEVPPCGWDEGLSNLPRLPTLCRVGIKHKIKKALKFPFLIRIGWEHPYPYAGD